MRISLMIGLNWAGPTAQEDQQISELAHRLLLRMGGPSLAYRPSRGAAAGWLFRIRQATLP